MNQFKLLPFAILFSLNKDVKLQIIKILVGIHSFGHYSKLFTKNYSLFLNYSNYRLLIIYIELVILNYSISTPNLNFYID